MKSDESDITDEVTLKDNIEINKINIEINEDNIEINKNKIETNEDNIEIKDSEKINEEFSDLDSIFDTPKKAKLRSELRRKIRIQRKHSLKIQSLRRKNLRLKKKIATLKHIIVTLKK